MKRAETRKTNYVSSYLSTNVGRFLPKLPAVQMKVAMFRQWTRKIPYLFLSLVSRLRGGGCGRRWGRCGEGSAIARESRGRSNEGSGNGLMGELSLLLLGLAEVGEVHVSQGLVA